MNVALHKQFSSGLAGMAAAFILVFGFLLPQIYLLSIAAPAYSFAGLISWAVILYATTRMVQLSLSGQPRLMQLMFWAFVYIFFGLTPLVEFAHGGVFHWGHDSYRLTTVYCGLGIVIASSIAFDLGARTRPLPAAKILVAGMPLQKKLASGKIRFLGAFALASAVYVTLRLGGLSNLFLSRTDRLHLISQIAGGGDVKVGLFHGLIRVPSFVSCLLLIVYMRNYKSAAGKSAGALTKFLALATGLTAVIICNPVATPRFWCGTVFLGFAFALLKWRRSTGFAISGGILLSLALLFPIASSFRKSTDLSVVAKTASVKFSRGFLGGDFDAFQQVLNVTTYVERRGVDYGEHLLGAALFWVPRSIWKGKPKATGEFIANYRGYVYKNLSMPLAGEMYLAGGFPAVLIFFFFYGNLLSKLDHFYSRSYFTASRDLVSAFVPLFAPYQFFLLRGSLLPAVAFLAPAILFLALAVDWGIVRRQAQQTYHGRDQCA